MHILDIFFSFWFFLNIYWFFFFLVGVYESNSCSSFTYFAQIEAVVNSFEKLSFERIGKFHWKRIWDHKNICFKKWNEMIQIQSKNADSIQINERITKKKSNQIVALTIDIINHTYSSILFSSFKYLVKWLIFSGLFSILASKKHCGFFSRFVLFWKRKLNYSASCTRQPTFFRFSIRTKSFWEIYILKIGEKIISKNGYDNTEIQTNRQNPLNTNRML